jgi:hypothetical protein
METNTLPQLDPAEVAAAIGIPVPKWHHQCHVISLAIVKSGLLPGSRVARGVTPGVGGQHSWIVVGDDCYDPEAVVVDPTLWSYVPGTPTIWVGLADERPHTPHGAGSIWDVGRPPEPTGEVMALKPTTPLSVDAQRFLDMAAPLGLDATGWMILASSLPVQGWPAGEVYAAMDDTPGLGVFVPVDRLGMLTSRNPDGLYLPDDYQPLGAPARPAYQCIECSHTEVGTHVDLTNPNLACAQCEDQGADDPYCIERFMVTRCTDTTCTDENQWGARSEHWVAVES